jgi:excisionase family DNA binding protein
MTSQQFKFNPDSTECEITFRIPLQPFINLLADKLQPIIIEPKVDLTLTSREAAAYLRISYATLWRWIKGGKIKYIKRGSKYCFKESSLEELNVEVRLKGIKY